MAALSMGTDVLQPLMPFSTAFQLLREPITAKGAGLRLKRKWGGACTGLQMFTASDSNKLTWLIAAIGHLFALYTLCLAAWQ
jgi:hypothetical protein